MTDEAWRAKADYWDVWSGIFRDTFFGVQAEWCARNNVEYLVHLNHEENALRLDLPEDHIKNEGDYFETCGMCEVPGIDNLSQLVPNRVHAPDGDVEREQQLPQAGFFGGAPVRQAQGLDRIGRRTGHRRQVPVGFSTGARRQCAAGPRSRGAAAAALAGRQPRRRRRRPCWRGTPTAPAT